MFGTPPKELSLAFPGSSKISRILDFRLSAPMMVILPGEEEPSAK